MLEKLCLYISDYIERNKDTYKMSEMTGIKLPIIENGIKTGARELLKQILYA